MPKKRKARRSVAGLILPAIELAVKTKNPSIHRNYLGEVERAREIEVEQRNGTILVIGILNKLGLSISYDELQRIDSNVTHRLIESAGSNRVPVSLPSNNEDDDLTPVDTLPPVELNKVLRQFFGEIRKKD